MSLKSIRSITSSRPTMEGAGVRLRRAFGFGNTEDYDPFLLLDDFRGDSPADYSPGFPWHPHRGIETITYVLAGTVEHKDSLGNHGLLGPGDLQWMTAGSGIIHEEMPAGDELGRMHGFQLWANLPSRLKMTDPRYQDIKAAQIPEVIDDSGMCVRILCGTFRGTKGPVEGVAAAPLYLDIYIPANRSARFPVEPGHHAFAYVFEGAGSMDGEKGAPPHAVENRNLILFGEGDEIAVTGGSVGLRFLLASGRPLGEPVAWHGPIVMNTQAEIETALLDLERGTFLKDR